MTNHLKTEFSNRIERLRQVMAAEDLDLFLVFGDEYRRENLRYVCNYWPIFERGLLVIARSGEPVLLVAPECEFYAKEMSVWSDVRLVHEMSMAYVADTVSYSPANAYTTLEAVFASLLGGKNPRRLKVCGVDAMSSITLEAIRVAGQGAEVVNGDKDLYDIRLLKSPFEIQMLAKVWEICDAGYKAILEADLVGLTEIQAAAIGEKAARDAGAEGIVFSIFASGERTNTVIGRASEKLIQKGDTIMSALAVQYAGYIASDEWPFTAGGQPTAAQLELARHLIKAEDIGVQMIRDGVVAGNVVRAMRDYFASNGLSKYDLYPPIHGNGLAEAENPYPDENTTYTFKQGMGVNFDVSLFGLPDVGSNRIEEGFIVGKDGLIVLSKLIDGMRKDFLKKYG